MLDVMTRALDAAIAKLATLPADEQDQIARWLLDELRDDENWARQFASSQDSLSKLAAEARVERSAGRAAELDPDKLRGLARRGAPGRDPSYSVRVTLGYRAVGLLEDEGIAWFWIGTHAQYDRLHEQL